MKEDYSNGVAAWSNGGLGWAWEDGVLCACTHTRIGCALLCVLLLWKVKKTRKDVADEREKGRPGCSTGKFWSKAVVMANWQTFARYWHLNWKHRMKWIDLRACNSDSTCVVLHLTLSLRMHLQTDQAIDG